MQKGYGFVLSLGRRERMCPLFFVNCKEHLSHQLERVRRVKCKTLLLVLIYLNALSSRILKDTGQLSTQPGGRDLTRN